MQIDNINGCRETDRQLKKKNKQRRQEDLSTTVKSDKEDMIHITETLSDFTYHTDELSDSKQIRRLDKYKKIQKTKLKQTVYGFKMVLRLATMDLYEQQQQQEQFIFRQIPNQKVFFVAGDILVELKGSDDLMSNVIFNEFRNIVHVEKTSEAVTFQIESARPLKYLSEVVYYLENSQDQSSYEFSQQLKDHQITINVMQDQINQLVQNYYNSPIDLQSIVKERAEYVKALKQKFISEIVSKDEFTCVGTLSISYQNQTTTLSEMSITRPTIALIGADDEEIALHFIRKGFIKLFNSHSRRFIFSSNMLFQMKREEDFEINMPQFEISTMDDIHIVCQCKLKSKLIKFPPHLQFQGDNIDILNSIEQLVYIQYFITPQHLESIIKIRSQYQNKSPQNQTFPENYHYKQCLELEDFEYNMQCQIFLEKYYQDMLDKMENDKKKNEQIDNAQIQEDQNQQVQQSCGYRFIS